MARQQPDGNHDDLRYLEARHVRCAAGTLAGLPVCTQDDEALGAVNGVLLDPVKRRLRYFVVEAPARFLRSRYLLPADAPVTLDRESGRLRIEADADDIDRERFDASAVRRFSDEDVITAVFSSPAA